MAGVTIDDPIYPVDIIDDIIEDKIINKMTVAEIMNEIRQYGPWAVTAVEMLITGFSFSKISKKLNIKKADLIQKLTLIAEGRGQLGFDFGGKI